jgi:hypothetical protein
VATPRLARLSRLQWENTVRDLLQVTGIDEILSQVSGDAVVGFDNEIGSLFVGDQQRADFESAAQALATKVVADSAAIARLIPASAPADSAGKAKAFITSFGLRAYRRPLSDAEIQSYVSLFNQGPTLYPGTDAFNAGLNLVLQAFLQSPHFLYRTELGSAAVAGKIPLSDYEVAAKLSYSLTNSMPDAELFTAAAASAVHSANDVASQATRLASNAKGAEGRDHFHFQVYRLGAYDGIVRDTAAFPSFTANTPSAMRQETLLFLRYVFDQGFGVKQMFTSPVSFVNADLAPAYGLSGSFGNTFTKVDLDPNQRAGLLTRTGFLSSYAVVNDPDSIHRGVFVNQRVLCVDLPPPDPNATGLVPLSTDMTNRERVEATTGPGTCGQGCHSTIINPPGFAFEHFDAVGKFRDTDRGKPINSVASYAFAEGLKAFDGALEFSQALAQSKQAHSCYVGDWMTYLNGRLPVAAEKPLLDYLSQLSLNGQLSMKDMILRFVTNDGFLNRLP